jgi:hypothetical protein
MPNGKASRRLSSIQHRDQESNMNVAIARRIRDHKLVDVKRAGKIVTAVQQALDPRCGYALGILLLSHKITEQQHSAGVKFSEDMARYYGLTGVPFPSPRAQDLFAIRSDGDEPAGKGEAAKAARGKMAKLREALLAVGDIDTGRRVYMAVTSTAVEDKAPPESGMVYLRKGLNRLVDHYGIAV